MRKVRDTMGLTNVELMILRAQHQGGRAGPAILKENGLERGRNKLRIIMMCEIPSNAILADEFLKHFDGFSIGSNDMTQLTLALDRDSGLVMEAFDERDAAVKRMLHLAIQACRKAASTSASAARARAITRPRRVAHGGGHRVDVAQSRYRGGDMAAPGEVLQGLRRPVIAWRFARFDELTARELHDAFQLRSAVFVVEQTCPFLDIDGADPACWHLLGFAGKDKLVAYSRLVPPA
jgi:hypothetical protein